MAQNNGVKVCPTCFYKNAGNARSCVNCKKRLTIGVVAQPASPPKIEPPPTPPDQKPSRQTPSDFSDPFPKQRLAPKKNPLVLSVLALALITVSFLVFIAFKIKNGPTPVVIMPAATHVPTPTPTPSNAIGEMTNATGHVIGINDGSFAPFDIGRRDLALKQQAYEALKEGNSSAAVSLWQQTLAVESNDPEALIYIEDQRVLASGEPYITLVAGVAFTPPFPDGSSESDLQGVYVAQHEFNTNNHSFQVRVLIANSGDHATDITAIAQQIVHLTQKDPTIVGVISWLSSAENLTALPIVANAHLPMISPAASSDQLTDISSLFFRVVPPNRFQGKATALFAEQSLHVQKVVVFIDNNDPYSQNLAQDFEKQFRQDKGVVLKEESFTTDRTSKIGNLIQDALATNPDALYFTSRDTSDVINFQDALPTSGPFAHTPALAGDAGYVIHKAGYGRWYFASFAFPNELENIVNNSSPFYQDYSDDVNQDGLKPPGYYGYTRPDDNAILSYDVTSVFLAAMQMAIGNNKIAVTPAGLQSLTADMVAHTLPHVVLQGVSGLIEFDAAHDPINKAFVFLAASPDGHTYMKDWQGCFTATLCHTVS